MPGPHAAKVAAAKAKAKGAAPAGAAGKPGGLVLVGKSEERITKALDVIAPHIGRLVAKHIDAGRLLELAFYLVRKTPRLQECTQASFYGALMQCAKYSLYPDLRGQCWVIPRKTGPYDSSSNMKSYEAHFQVGYQGLLDLARRSREVRKIEARVVYEGDDFDYRYGTRPFIKHRPMQNREGERTLTYAYAIAYFMAGGDPQFEVLDRYEIERFRAVAQNTEDADSPWNKWEREMWQKTVAIRLCKFLPASIELQEVAALDEAFAAGRRIENPLPVEALQQLGETLGTVEDEDEITLSDMLDDGEYIDVPSSDAQEPAETT